MSPSPLVGGERGADDLALVAHEDMAVCKSGRCPCHFVSAEWIHGFDQFCAAQFLAAPGREPRADQHSLVGEKKSRVALRRDVDAGARLTPISPISLPLSIPPLEEASQAFAELVQLARRALQLPGTGGAVRGCVLHAADRLRHLIQPGELLLA